MGNCEIKNVSIDTYEKYIDFIIYIRVSKNLILKYYIKSQHNIEGIVVKNSTHYHNGFYLIKNMERGISMLRGFMNDSRNFKLFEEKINEFFINSTSGKPEGDYKTMVDDLYSKLKLNMGMSTE